MPDHSDDPTTPPVPPVTGDDAVGEPAAPEAPAQGADTAPGVPAVPVPDAPVADVAGEQAAWSTPTATATAVLEPAADAAPTDAAAPAPAPEPDRRIGGFSLAAVITAGVAFVVAFLIPGLGALLGIQAIAFGIIALVVAVRRRRRTASKALGIIGIVVGGVTLVVALVMTIVYALTNPLVQAELEEAFGELDETSQEAPAPVVEEEPVVVDDESADGEADAAAGDADKTAKWELDPAEVEYYVTFDWNAQAEADGAPWRATETDCGEAPTLLASGDSYTCLTSFDDGDLIEVTVLMTDEGWTWTTD
ncbi:hypothetical protein [Agromyces sp. SYSU T00194]|uniref:hypothetical protein n=1 Tax=Agromyces chitinivorans TaxID=3158560 RepID=UPI003395F5CE